MVAICTYEICFEIYSYKPKQTKNIIICNVYHILTNIKIIVFQLYLHAKRHTPTGWYLHIKNKFLKTWQSLHVKIYN